MSVTSTDPSNPYLASNYASPPPSPPKDEPPLKRKTHRRASYSESFIIPKDQLYTARPKTESLMEEELKPLVQENSLPSLVVNEPRLTIKDFIIQARVMQKIANDSMTPHALVTSYNILALCLEKAQTMTESTRLKIIDAICEKMDRVVGDIPHCIQQTLNIPTYITKSLGHNIDLDRLCKRAKNIDTLVQILIPHMNYCELEKVELNADLVCIFPRLNQVLSNEKKFTISIPSPFSNLKTASTHFKSHYPNLAKDIQKWIERLESLSEVEELDLSSSHLNDIPEQICRLLTHVKKLSFQNNKSEAFKILITLQSLTSLEELDLSDNKFFDLPPNFFDDLANLKKLDLRNNCFSPEAASYIQTTCENREILLLI